MPASCKAMQHRCPLPTNFSSAIAVLVLHHLRSRKQQDRAFAEVRRVLQPGAHFFAFEIQTDGSIASFTSTARSSQSRPMHLRFDWPPQDSSISLSIAEPADLAFARPQS